MAQPNLLENKKITDGNNLSPAFNYYYISAAVCATFLGVVFPEIPQKNITTKISNYVCLSVI
jgi:hypothetical protein